MLLMRVSKVCVSIVESNPTNLFVDVVISKEFWAAMAALEAPCEP